MYTELLKSLDSTMIPVCHNLRRYANKVFKGIATDGKVVFALPSKSEVNRVLDYIEKNGKLPDEYDYVLTTYSQVSNGVYEFDENGVRKEKKLAKGKTFGAAMTSRTSKSGLVAVVRSTTPV